MFYSAVNRIYTHHNSYVLVKTLVETITAFDICHNRGTGFDTTPYRTVEKRIVTKKNNCNKHERTFV